MPNIQTTAKLIITATDDSSSLSPVSFEADSFFDGVTALYQKYYVIVQGNNAFALPTSFGQFNIIYIKNLAPANSSDVILIGLGPVTSPPNQGQPQIFGVLPAQGIFFYMCGSLPNTAIGALENLVNVDFVAGFSGVSLTSSNSSSGTPIEYYVGT